MKPKPTRIDFTVAIPTYNGEQRLPEVFDKLLTQINTEQIAWEILVIDNNSTDQTKKVVEEYQKNWPSNHPLRYCFEPKKGLCFARQRAVEEAKGKFVGFLDDDNLPAPDWIGQAYEFGMERDRVGAYGSKIKGAFEINPPKNFERIAPLLALTDRGNQPCIYEPHKKLLPPGAGLVVRKQAWLENVPTNLLLGPKGNDKTIQRGEDLEAVLYIQKAGWELWYNPQMCVDHRIPRQRLEKDYLLKLCRNTGLARYHTRMLSVKPFQRPLAFLLYLLNDMRKIIFHLLKYNAAIRDDLVVACEMQLYIGCLVSPFYIWNKYGQK